jgi:hypothetical protein
MRRQDDAKSGHLRRVGAVDDVDEFDEVAEPQLVPLSIRLQRAKEEAAAREILEVVSGMCGVHLEYTARGAG